ncbi:MAG: molybdopterin-dependent oxidoreductase, partial [Bacteroidota bacterium]
MLHYRVCHLCEAMCGLEIEHNGTRVLSVRGDKKDPFSQGFICPKGARIAELHEDPNRLKEPLLKQPDGSWKAIVWEEAMQIAATCLNGIRKEHGLDAVGMYIGNPTVHNYGFLTYVGDLRRALKSRNIFSATSMDQLPHQFMAHELFGHTLHLAVPDIDRTDYLLIMGGNPAVSNGSLMSAGGVKPRLDDIRARNGRVVVIDPRRTETTKHADEHHFIYPGTDVYFLLALLQQVFENNWINRGHLADLLVGEQALKELVQEFTPDQVSELCGIPAMEIRKIARAYATTTRAVIYGRMGLSTQAHGTLCNWLVLILNLLTGHLDREGGAMFTTPAVDLVRRKRYKKTYGRYYSRVRGLPESEGELPVVTLAEEILTPGADKIRAM